MKSNIALVLLLSSFSVTAIGQNPTPVVDLSSPITVAQPSEDNVIGSADVQVAGNSYYQSQVLQEEVQMLRGMVEELTYELQQVKQRQMDDYLDLDRRICCTASRCRSVGESRCHASHFHVTRWAAC
jgi:TolA-binding protein